MNKSIDISGRLGEYMLKGWVLTDNTCHNAGCSVPLMRSPRGVTPVTQFCANCDGGPTTFDVSSSKPHSPTSVSSSSHVSRTSTPATELSSTLSSPTFAPPVETEESIRRRQQSDTASAEIGKRLLKGWAMLADECPNQRCYGVPLIRPPKAGGGKDPRKECVICSTVYIDERDISGFERLVPIVSEDIERDAFTSSSTLPSKPDDKERPMRYEQTPQTAKFALPYASTSQNIHFGHYFPTPFPDVASQASSLHSLTASALGVSARSLELTLHTLSEKLTSLSNNQTVDPSSIASTADAISKVTQALNHVKQLQWSENQAIA